MKRSSSPSSEAVKATEDVATLKGGEEEEQSYTASYADAKSASQLSLESMGTSSMWVEVMVGIAAEGGTGAMEKVTPFTVTIEEKGTTDAEELKEGT
jgi:hypothetical protein